MDWYKKRFGGKHKDMTLEEFGAFCLLEELIVKLERPLPLDEIPRSINMDMVKRLVLEFNRFDKQGFEDGFLYSDRANEALGAINKSRVKSRKSSANNRSKNNGGTLNSSESDPSRDRSRQGSRDGSRDMSPDNTQKEDLVPSIKKVTHHVTLLDKTISPEVTNNNQKDSYSDTPISEEREELPEDSDFLKIKNLGSDYVTVTNQMAAFKLHSDGKAIEAIPDHKREKYIAKMVENAREINQTKADVLLAIKKLEKNIKRRRNAVIDSQNFLKTKEKIIQEEINRNPMIEEHKIFKKLPDGEETFYSRAAKEKISENYPNFDLYTAKMQTELVLRKAVSLYAEDVEAKP